MKLKNPNPGRVLPPNFKFGGTFAFQRKFTWKERLQIAIGYTAKITMTIAMEHSPGKWDTRMVLETTKELLRKESQ